MNFWQYLLSVRPSANLRYDHVEVGWPQPWSLLWTVLVVLLAALLVGLFYRLEPRRLSTTRRVTLVGLRLLAVALLALILFRPWAFTAVFKGERSRPVVVLADNSASMSLKDRRLSTTDKLRVALATNLLPLGTVPANDEEARQVRSAVTKDPSRLDLLKAVLQHPELQLLDKAGKVGPLKLYTFGTSNSRVEVRDGDDPGTVLAEKLAGNDNKTALADALAEVLFRGESDPPAAIIVATDGLDHDSKVGLADVAQEAGKLGVPIHFVGIGSTEAGLVQLFEAPTPDLMFLDDTVAVPFRVGVQGVTQGTLKLSVLIGDKEVASKEVPIKDGGEIREVVAFTPSKEEIGKEEMQLLTTKVELKDRAGMADLLQRTVRVIDKKIKVLVVENIARWDFQFIMRGLLRDRRVEPSFLILQGDTETLSSGKPFLPAFPATRKDLLAYDLLILGDVPADKFSKEALGWIHDFVQEGGGLVCLAGRVHAPASWKGTPLEAVLPVEYEVQSFARNGEVRNPGFQVQLTRTGERSQMLALADTADDNKKAWEELPSIFWHYPVKRLKPGATALLTHPTKKLADDEPMPLLAQHHYGKGQVLFVGFEETWRWRFNRQDTVFARLWGQVVYAHGLRGSQGSLRTQVMADRTQATLGRMGKIYARLLDANLKPRTEKTVKATLEHFDARPGEPRTREVELELVPGSEGDYQLNLVHDKPGRFALKLAGDDPARVDYRVEVPTDHELAPLPLPVSRLEEAASASGGNFYREETIGSLPEALKPRQAVFTERSSIPLLNPLTFLLFLLLVTTEWVVRKFSNLS